MNLPPTNQPRALSRGLKNNGKLHWTRGQFVDISSSIVNNGTFHVDATIDLSLRGINGSGSTFFNHGLLQKTGFDRFSFIYDCTLTNAVDGVISILDSTIRLGSTSNNNGSVEHAAATTVEISNRNYGPTFLLIGAETLKFTDGTHVFPPGTLDGSGVTTFGPACVANVASVKLKRMMNNNGTFSHSGPGDVEMTNATLHNLQGGVINLTSGGNIGQSGDNTHTIKEGIVNANSPFS